MLIAAFLYVHLHVSEARRVFYRPDPVYTDVPGMNAFIHNDCRSTTTYLFFLHHAAVAHTFKWRRKKREK